MFGGGGGGGGAVGPNRLKEIATRNIMTWTSVPLPYIDYDDLISFVLERTH